ncbi:hypothetical protein GCM10020220_064710 [Nonomuraea rubra]
MFAEKPTLKGARVTLRPVGPEHVEGLLELVSDPDVRRLTGSHAGFDPDQLRVWYATRGDHPDRLDLAIMADDEYVGEVVLNELDTANLSCNLRIGLIGPRVFGKGYRAARRSSWCSATPSRPRRCTGSGWASTPSTSGRGTSTRSWGSWEEGVERDALPVGRGVARLRAHGRAPARLAGRFAKPGIMIMTRGSPEARGGPVASLPETWSRTTNGRCRASKLQ